MNSCSNVVLILLVQIALFINAQSSNSSKRIVCYYTNWSQYRPGIGRFVPENIDPFLCTNIIYAFAKLDETGILQPFEWNDMSTEWSRGMYNRMMDLKKKNKDLKISLAAGGWNFGSGPFSTLVHDEQARRNFVNTTVDFILQNGFDGFDIDWEYPGSREGSQVDDKQYFTVLIRELKKAFEPYGLLLTAAVAAGIETIERGYEIDQLSEYLDFVNIMAYDFHGSWDNYVGHNSPLYPRDTEPANQTCLNVDCVTNFYLSKGLSKEKLILGMATYGRTFTLADSSKTEFGSPVRSFNQAGSQGRFTREAGYLSYYEVCEKLLKQNWTYMFNDEQKAPYAYKSTEWVGFDTIKSLKLKAQYVLDNNLGGAMIWALDTDDFDGKFCNQGKFPLINTIKSVLEGTFNESTDTEFATTTTAATTTLTTTTVNTTVANVTSTTPESNATTTQGSIVSNNSTINSSQTTETTTVSSTLSTTLVTTRSTEASTTAKSQDNTASSKKKLVCYYTNWSQYRLPGTGRFVPENIDPFLCTNIIYAFAKLEDGLLQPFEWNDLSTDWSRGMYDKVLDLKRVNKNLKVSLAAGGWNLGSGPFSDIVHNTEQRKRFVKTTVDFLVKNGFDGFDIDWEYPGSREGSQPDDKIYFTLLIKELKEAFKPKNLLLSAAVAAGIKTIESAYEIKDLDAYLDFVNLMTYDFHGAWDNYLGHNSPLYARKNESLEDTYMNIDYVTKYYLERGLSKEKLILGMPTYGRTFTLSDPRKTSLGSSALEAGREGRYTNEKGYFSYYEVCDKINNENWTTQFNDEQKVPYAYKGNQWVGYDNIQSIKLKTQYMLDKNLGGAMIWALDTDDFDGKFCNQGKYPLIKTIKSVIEGTFVEPSFTTTTTKSSTASTNPVVSTTATSLTTQRLTTITSSTSRSPSSSTISSTISSSTSSSSSSSITSTASSSTTSRTTMRTTSQEQPLKICYKGDGFYPIYEKKCLEYYRCTFTGTRNEMISYFNCPDGLAFDSTINACNFPQSVKCQKPLLFGNKPNNFTDKPDPANKFCYKGDGFYIKENSNCEQYYFCGLTNTDSLVIFNFTCLDDKKFNIETRNCEPDLTCDAEPIGELIEISAPIISSKLRSVCVKGDGVFADESRGCKYYFECSFTRTKYARYYEMMCPGNTYFDQKTKTCSMKYAC